MIATASLWLSAGFGDAEPDGGDVALAFAVDLYTIVFGTMVIAS